MNAPVTPSNELPVMIADGDSVWREEWFFDVLVKGLVEDGLDHDAASWLIALAKEKKPSNLKELQNAVQQKSTVDFADAVTLALDSLSKIAAFNASCYRRRTPEMERVVAWPNNARTRQYDPDYYFDIFEDLPYRDTHRFITPETPIGSAGSCFALRIAHQLQHWNYNYVIEEDDLPLGTPLDAIGATNYRMAPARSGTLFNTPSMRQMVERAFGEWSPDPLLVKDGSRYIDPFRSIRPNYTDEAGFIADYERHSAALRRALEKCDVFVFTLGLSEAWRFAHNGDYTSVAPHRIDPTLLRAHELTVEENVNELERLLSVYRKYKPDIKLIVSVSPVPLMKTFSSSNHVVAANSLSKATLRVAAEKFCRNHPESVFYFPSFEVVTSGTRHPWEKDMRHVSPEAVERVMRLFQKMFILDQKSELPMLAHTEHKLARDPKRIAKGWIKVGLRRLGLYQ